jgi:formiminotetrahydrofolate cyclodeaminase
VHDVPNQTSLRDPRPPGGSSAAVSSAISAKLSAATLAAIQYAATMVAIY